MRETIPGRVLRRANNSPTVCLVVSFTQCVLDLHCSSVSITAARYSVHGHGRFLYPQQSNSCRPTANRLLSGRSSNLSHRRHHLQNASGVKNIRPCCETQVVSDVFVQGTLLVAALKIPTIVNFHNASGVIGLIVICMQYTGVGTTE